MALNNYLEGQMRIFREKNKNIGKYLQPTAMSTLLGTIFGIVMLLFKANNLSLTIRKGFEQLFMIVLLPPILFEAALNLKKKPFFKNIGGIVLYAFGGTLVAVFITAVLMWMLGAVGYAKDYTFYHCFVFGSLISATDPVSVLAAFKDANAHSRLHSLIFGESILNDAISLTLYRSLLDLKFKPTLSIASIVIKFSLLVLFSGVIGLFFGIIASLVVSV